MPNRHEGLPIGFAKTVESILLVFDRGLAGASHLFERNRLVAEMALRQLIHAMAHVT